MCSSTGCRASRRHRDGWAGEAPLTYRTRAGRGLLASLGRVSASTRSRRTGRPRRERRRGICSTSLARRRWLSLTGGRQGPPRQSASRARRPALASSERVVEHDRPRPRGSATGRPAPELNRPLSATRPASSRLPASAAAALESCRRSPRAAVSSIETSDLDHRAAEPPVQGLAPRARRRSTRARRRRAGPPRLPCALLADLLEALGVDRQADDLGLVDLEQRRRRLDALQHGTLAVL